MPAWKLFADKLTDLEDELQRLRELCACSHDPEAAKAASLAGERLIELARIVMDRGDGMPLAERYR